jgi:hypothetical protein
MEAFPPFLHAAFSFTMDFPPLADCFRCPPISTHLFSCRAYFRSAKRGKKMQTRLFRFLPCFLLAIKTFPGLAMESQNLPEASAYTLNLGLAAASASLQIPLLQSRLGVRFSGNRSFTEAMFRLNGLRDEFVEPPGGNDGNLSLIWQYSPTGRLKFFNFASNDRIGVIVHKPSFAATYRGDCCQEISATNIFTRASVHPSTLPTI